MSEDGRAISSEALHRDASDTKLLRQRRQSLAVNGYTSEIVTLVRSVERKYFSVIDASFGADTSKIWG